MQAHDEQHHGVQGRSPVRTAAVDGAAGGSIAYLQRTVGNAAVGRLLGQDRPARDHAVPVQRYAEQVPDATGGQFAAVSDNGGIVLKDRSTAYATPELVGRAAEQLDRLERVAVTLDPAAPTAMVDGRQMQLVRVVYKSADKVRAPLRAAHEPVLGDSDESRRDKLKAYQQARVDDWVRNNAEVTVLYQELSRKGPTARLTLPEVGRTTGLISKTVGLAWGGTGGREERLRALNAPGATVQAALDLLQELARACANRLIEISGDAESALRQLVITVPNDCKQTAMRLTGLSPESLSREVDRPEPGDQHYVDFEHKDGWENHFACVVVRDGDDTLTYEAAADFAAEEFGKALGYFAMYGASSDGAQSFKAVMHGKNEEYADRKREAFGP
ncbi:hypothetical protein ACIGXM_04555 [Kitasatospora sp. NPDC052896]|uniref:hypothetical protein n=1 Tax=Kitasatospora sp. NPDC052896 TaxID=3364061 RepID=UPI0037CA1A1C